jgi:serine/threonine-protein kinase
MPTVGDLLAGRYRILGPMGAGGMATVHRARDERLERDVAVKVLLPNLAGDPALAARFEREARTLAAAAHPGIVSVYDVDPGDPKRGREPFFVMELCAGGSLADRLTGGQRLAPDDLVPILVSVAEGLAALHERGVVHRDVKPSNMLFAPDRAKLADFGLARSDSADLSDLTAPGTVAGTMAYLAPEVLAGEPAAAPADVYGLGVAAFVGLTGAPLRPATSLGELVATAHEAARRVSETAPDLGDAFDEPIAAAVDPDPARRPDALAFATSLTMALGRWSRTRPPGAAMAPPSPAVLATDATTVLAAALADRLPDRPGGDEDQRSRRALRPLAGLALLVVGALALWAFASTLLGDGSNGSLAGSSPPPASPPPSAVPNPSFIAPPSPSANSPTGPTVADRALTALDEVDAAIAGTAGKDGLKGNERKELEELAAGVRAALEDGDTDSARQRAEDLADKVDDLDDDLDEERARRLADAVSALLEILGGD